MEPGNLMNLPESQPRCQSGRKRGKVTHKSKRQRRAVIPAQGNALGQSSQRERRRAEGPTYRTHLRTENLSARPRYCLLQRPPSFHQFSAQNKCKKHAFSRIFTTSQRPHLFRNPNRAYAIQTNFAPTHPFSPQDTHVACQTQSRPCPPTGVN